MSASRLIAKLRAKGLHNNILRVIASWLGRRSASVVLEGCRSQVFELFNMVFQGTVWGPALWNCFFEDARFAINAEGFDEVVFADDCNAFKAYSRQVSNDIILEDLRDCQASLHRWGLANQACFDPAKESFSIISTTDAHGEPSRILGIDFDAKLQMGSAIHACAVEASWKLRTIVRTRRFYTDAELVLFFKSHILSFIEYRTPAVYHAATTTLRPLDQILCNFLKQVNVSDMDALMHFGLAPLRTRRDIAMLGVIHRSVLGHGPAQFQNFFKLKPVTTRSRRRWHSKHLDDPREWASLGILSRSALGLVRVYNLLPQAVVDSASTSSFQRALQSLVRQRAHDGCTDWADTLSPRRDLLSHPLFGRGD